MPELLVFGQRNFDGPTALYALYDYVSTGKRGARGTLIPDADAAFVLSVEPQTIAAWRTSLADLGLLQVEREGRAWRKRVTTGHHAARFVLVPALLVRALLGGECSRLGFRTWAMLVNQRIEPGRGAGAWRSIPWLAHQLGGREEATVSATLAELATAGLLRIDEYGPGQRRRLVPLFARPVTQHLPKRVREAAAALARRVGLAPRGSLRRPRLAGTAAATPSAQQGHGPPAHHGHPAPPAGPSTQVGGGRAASPPGRDLVGSYLPAVPSPPLSDAEIDRLPSWLRERARERAARAGGGG